MIPRRRAREVALQVLVALDYDPDMGADHALATYFANFSGLHGDADERPEGTGDDLDRPFAEALVRGVADRRAALDERLARLSRTWRPERMARVDRNILRMALYELFHREDVPAPVAINEAVELAKRFGAAEAPAFINGVLDSAANDRPR